ncbi:flagellar export chaperone FliS [Bacillus sp. NPDC077027]|uniref:flagellar export chaperone FliS n=1 Tax=Bacillus sp. NPDC077027 TaxID=3390548 RepID=UPI003CFD11F9
MAIQNPYAAYQKNSIETATPAELTLMLYEGCLKFIKLARYAMDQNNTEMRNQNLKKAQNIIQELNVTLDRSYEVSKSMASMYDYIYRRLIDANLKNESEILDEVEQYVIDFRDAWKEVIQSDRKGRHQSIGGSL